MAATPVLPLSIPRSPFCCCCAVVTNAQDDASEVEEEIPCERRRGFRSNADAEEEEEVEDQRIMSMKQKELMSDFDEMRKLEDIVRVPISLRRWSTGILDFGILKSQSD